MATVNDGDVVEFTGGNIAVYISVEKGVVVYFKLTHNRGKPLHEPYTLASSKHTQRIVHNYGNIDKLIEDWELDNMPF